MDIKITRDGDKGMAEINGDIDEKGAEILKAKVKELDNVKEITIDLGGVGYMGSSGIGKLLLFYKKIGVQGGKIRVVNVRPDLYRLFQELKLDTIFTVMPR
jgi:anti-sigma B factor antagonist